MGIMTYEQWSNVFSTCEKCGEEFWGDTDTCPDCRDSDVEPSDSPTQYRIDKRRLPSFGIPTTKSQNIYYL